jgi:hypothetical protein
MTTPARADTEVGEPISSCAPARPYRPYRSRYLTVSSGINLCACWLGKRSRRTAGGVEPTTSGYGTHAHGTSGPGPPPYVGQLRHSTMHLILQEGLRPGGPDSREGALTLQARSMAGRLKRAPASKRRGDTCMQGTSKVARVQASTPTARHAGTTRQARTPDRLKASKGNG